MTRTTPPARVPAALLAAAALLGACEKNAIQELPQVTPTARVKFFNYGINAPGVNFYANNNKITAVSAASCTPVTSTTDTTCFGKGLESTTGTAYGGSAAGGFYSALAPGQYTLTGRITAATDNGLSVATVSATLEDGKSYSLFLSGPYNATTKQSDAFLLEDAYAANIDYSAAYVRFVNASYNSNALALSVKNADTTVAKTEVAVGGAVAYKAAGAFVAVPSGVYSLYTRASGAAAIVDSATAVSLGAGRVYTVALRGDRTVTGTTNANRPILTTSTNR